MAKKSPSVPPSPVARRRTQRAQVQNRIKGVFLRCDELANGEIRVHNISELGIGVQTQHLENKPRMGAAFEGTLRVGYTKAPVHLRAVHLSPEITGFELNSPSVRLRGAIRTFFEAELAGASLQLKDPGTTETRYEDRSGNSLVFHLDAQGEPVHFSMDTLGLHVEWSPQQGLLFIQNEITWPLDDFLRKELIKFIRNIATLPATQKEKIEFILRSSH